MVTLSAASLLALIQAVVAFLLTGLLCLSNQKAARWLAGFTFFFGTSLLLPVFGQLMPTRELQLLLSWLSFLALFAVPCLYRYMALALHQGESRWQMHFLPAPVIGGATLILLLTGEIAIAFELLRWALVVQLCGYGFYILSHIRRYRRQLRNDHSTLQGIDLKWLETLVLLLLVLVAFDVTLFPLLGWFGVPHTDIQLYFNTLASLYVLWLAKGAARQHFIAVEDAPSMTAKAPAGSLDDESLVSLAQDIEKQMNEGRHYQNPTLTLGDLAAEMKLSRHLVSEVINRGHGKNFYDFINDFRVDAAKSLLVTTSKTVLEAAFEAGFNNKASFNRAFKARVGLTPSQFRREQTAEKT